MKENLANQLVTRISEDCLNNDKLQLYNIVCDCLSIYKVTIDGDNFVKHDIREVVKYFLDCKRTESLSNGTIRGYTKVLNGMLKDIQGSLCDVNVNLFRHHIANLSKVNKQITVVNKVSVIKNFLSWAHAEGYCKTNLSNRISTPKSPKNIRRYLSVTDIENVRRACNTPRERALVEFLLSTGCRVSEVVGLKHSDIVNDSITIHGKGNKERIVFINEKAKLYLNLYKDSKGYKSEYIFDTKMVGHKYIESRAMQKILKNVGDRFELRVYPHILRHSFASLLLNNNMSLSAIQELLGHETIATTQIYAKNDIRKIRNEYELHSVI